MIEDKEYDAVVEQEALQTDFFFWLGKDAEVTEVTKDEFDGKQDELREELDNWLNVRFIPDID